MGVPAVFEQTDAPLPLAAGATTIAYLVLATVAGWAYLHLDPTVFATLEVAWLRWLLVGFAVMGTAFVATATAATIGQLYLAVRRAP